MKKCSKCSTSKPFDQFHNSARSKDGLRSTCKICRRIEDPGANARAKRYYENNREHVLANVKDYAKRNPDVAMKAQKTWLDKNGFVYQQQWKFNNPERVLELTAKRWRALKTATPQWADVEEIKGRYEEARLKTETTGTPHEVDHIVPLQSRLVCGLHVSHNLQVVTRRENAAKHNLRWPDMP